MTPDRVFLGNASMNAAYALFSERLLSRGQYMIPYRSLGFDNRGQDLLRIWDEVPFDACYDRELVDAWAKELAISDWYQWIPFDQGSK